MARFRQPGEPKGSRDSQPRFSNSVQNSNQVGSSVIEGYEGNAPVKFRADLDFILSTKPSTRKDADSDVDRHFSCEALSAAKTSEHPTWADMGVDVSGGDDPFHADWPFWTRD